MDAGVNHGNSGYTSGCRCDVCKEARNLHNKAYKRAAQRALKYFRQRNPEMWDRFLDEEYEDLGIERNPVGKPKDPNAIWSNSIFDY